MYIINKYIITWCVVNTIVRVLFDGTASLSAWPFIYLIISVIVVWRLTEHRRSQRVVSNNMDKYSELNGYV